MPKDPNRPLSFHDLRPRPAERQAEIRTDRFPIALLLDRLDDPGNLGLLFRLADAARLQEIILWQTPMDEPGRKTRRIARSTVPIVPFRHLQTEAELAALADEYSLVALEYTNRSIPYTEFQPTGPVLLLAGNEQEGLSPLLLDAAEASIHLPMYGLNSSLNVACAASVAVYDLLGKFRT